MGGDRRAGAKMLQQVCKACTASRFVEKLINPFPILMPSVYLANALSYTSKYKLDLGLKKSRH